MISEVAAEIEQMNLMRKNWKWLIVIAIAAVVFVRFQLASTPVVVEVVAKTDVVNLNRRLLAQVNPPIKKPEPRADARANKLRFRD